jgi:predicted transcriptional regulator
MSPPSDGKPDATLVANRLRVAVVETLAARSNSQPVDLDELAELVARRCDQTESNQLEVGLHHSHLQTLERAGVIDYDAASLSVEPNSQDVLDALLARFETVKTGTSESTASAVTPGHSGELVDDGGLDASTPKNDD